MKKYLHHLFVISLVVSILLCMSNNVSLADDEKVLNPYGYGFESPTADVPFSLYGESLPQVAQSFYSYYYFDEDGVFILGVAMKKVL